MSRYAIYAIPGVESDAPAAARRLYDTAVRWYERADVQDVTAGPRRYGFHATLKAPFRLTEAVTEADLHAHAATFALSRGPLMIAGPKPTVVGRFRALTPAAGSDRLDRLGAEVVRAFDALRAPLTEAEYRRREPERLTVRQRALLDRWGYPYVFDEFLFHMTITDSLPRERAADVDRAIDDHFAQVTGIDVPLTSLAVCVEPTLGEGFTVLSVHQFSMNPHPK